MHDVTEKTIESKAALGVAELTTLETPGGMNVRPMCLMIQDLMPQAVSSASGISYVQIETIPNPPDAAIAPGEQKTDAGFVGSHKQAKFRKAAAFQKISDEMYRDEEQRTGFVESFLVLGLSRAVEKLIVGEFLTAGLPTTAPSGTLNDIQTGKSAIRRAGFEPDGVVISPGDFEDLRSGAGMEHDGVFGVGVRSELGTVYFDRVLKLPVVESSAIPDGTILIGAFAGGSMLFKRGEAATATTESNDGDFARNLVTVRTEQRTATVIFALPAFFLITA